MRLCSVSVDLDEVRHYFAIHGLGQPPPDESNVVYETALERLGGLAAAQRIPLTLFAVGADAAHPANAVRLRYWAEAGHEIANHSLDHRYDLTRLGQEAMERQVIEAVTVLERATGQRPVGFRAPGYLMNDALFDVVRNSGAQYDSSVFPCPAYGMAKLLALGYGRLRKRRSSSIPGSPAAWLGPTRPYYAGGTDRRAGKGLLSGLLRCGRFHALCPSTPRQGLFLTRLTGLDIKIEVFPSPIYTVSRNLIFGVKRVKRVKRAVFIQRRISPPLCGYTYPPPGPMPLFVLSLVQISFSSPLPKFCL